MDTETYSRLLSGQLTGIRRLDLSCGLDSFPRQIFDLADSIEILNLSGNQLDSLPDDLPRLHKLKAIFCSDNRFTRLPEVLGKCRSLDMVGFKANQICDVPPGSLPTELRWLILTDNRIDELPAAIGSRPRLQKLMLAGNRLTALPESLAACERLELLRISANRLEALPGWIPSHGRLAWLAFGANRFNEDSTDISSSHPLPLIDWSCITLAEKLGEGASGVIYRASQRNEHSTQEIAVKLFRGAVTSDGLPESEWAACMAAGTHRTIVGASGRIHNHPEGRHGLAMPLVPPTYSVLAAPPSLESCTRDIYPDRLRLTPATAVRIACDIAEAASHLHARGILHGDLYAHNILTDNQGNALLGDFGAATFLDGKNQELSNSLQRMEVRAFACLLEELVAKCNDNSHKAIRSMQSLHKRCHSSDSRSRPLFSEIREQLGQCEDYLGAEYDKIA